MRTTSVPARVWLVFALLAALAFGLWYRFAYPRFSLMDFSLDRAAATAAASRYLAARGASGSDFSVTAVFDNDQWADRYLQKTLKSGADAFVRGHDYELYYWIVRFYRPLSKEEYLVGVSPRTGEVIKFAHLIEDYASRPSMEKAAARAAAEEFLRSSCGLDLSGYDFHEEKETRFDRRTDYHFSWEKKGVYIPWIRGDGGAKLLSSVTVSGGDVLEFHKLRLDVPETFERHIQNQLVLGEYLYSIYFLFYISLVGWASAIFIKRRQHLTIRGCKNWYIFLGFSFIAAGMLYVANNLQLVYYSYPTSTAPVSYLGLTLIKLFTDSLFMAVMFVVPGIVGESIRADVFPQKPLASFQHYLRSTFLSRGVAQAVLLGYLVCVIMLGLQAVIFHIGQNTVGVWREWIRMTQFSSAYVPALSAFVIAVMASLSEEVVFRLFGISLFTKYFRRAVWAVILTAFVWGFGHSQYAVFPVWFRGIEVGLIGCFFGAVFLRCGIIPLLVAHYLFDAFWGIAPHILSRSPLPLFLQALGIMLLPAAWAAAAWWRNRPEIERDVVSSLDKVQTYNLEVLRAFARSREAAGSSADEIRRELLAHNWDAELVDRVFKRDA